MVFLTQFELILFGYILVSQGISSNFSSMTIFARKHFCLFFIHSMHNIQSLFKSKH